MKGLVNAMEIVTYDMLNIEAGIFKINCARYGLRQEIERYYTRVYFISNFFISIEAQNPENLSNF